MFVLSCRDLEFELCDHVATGETVRQLQDAMFIHAREKHPGFISGITTDEREGIRLAMANAIAVRMCHDRAQQFAE
jgi:predicted small metal-binding protein